MQNDADLGRFFSDGGQKNCNNDMHTNTLCISFVAVRQI